MITQFKIFESYRITDPLISSIVKYIGKNVNDDIYPCDVWITNGHYLSITNGHYLSKTIVPGELPRVSNFWYWKRILDDGTLSKEEHGYGDFEYSDIVEYKIWTEEEIRKIYPIKKSMKKYNL